MKIWFQCKIKHEKENDEGIRKMSTTQLLIDALSYTEAEATCYQYGEQNISGEFMIKSISKTNISEVQVDPEIDAEFFKCKISYLTVDENAGKEKKVSTYILVQGGNTKEVSKSLEEIYKNMLVPYTVDSIVKTAINEVSIEEVNSDQTEENNEQ